MSERWDEDFLFQQAPHSNRTSSAWSDTDPDEPVSDCLPERPLSTCSDRSLTDQHILDPFPSTKPKRRLKRRLPVGELRLEEPSSGDDDHVHHRQPRSTTLYPDEGPTSPRRLLARGISSLQKRFSSSTAKVGPDPSTIKPRDRPTSPLPSSVSSSPVLLSRIDNSATACPFRPPESPICSRSPELVSSPTASATSFYTSTYHLPTRSSSTISLVKPSKTIKPKVASPTKHFTHSSPQPTNGLGSRQTPQSAQLALDPSSSSFPRRSSQESTWKPLPPTSFISIEPPDLASLEPTLLNRFHRLSFGRKSHASSFSVDSGPVHPLPNLSPILIREGPRLPSTGTKTRVSNPDGLKTFELQRSVSTPSVSRLDTQKKNSLSELKIPSRVASTQKALREKVVVVKEFAAKVQDLKHLHVNYTTLYSSLSYLSSQPLSSRSIRRLSCPLIQRSFSDSSFTALQSIERQYQPWWEMAEVLIKLGRTSGDESEDEPLTARAIGPSPMRERAITLLPDQRPWDSAKMPPLPPLSLPRPELESLVAVGPPSTPPGTVISPPKASPEKWRASTGRNDLSKRQLDVLRGMLTIPLGSPPTIQSILAQPPPPSSTISLPPLLASPSRSFPSRPTPSEPDQKPRSARTGLKGLRDFLRSLRISSEGSAEDVAMAETAAIPSTSADPAFQSNAMRKSARRPSLASIFRFGSSSTVHHEVSSSSGGGGGGSSGGDRGRGKLGSGKPPLGYPTSGRAASRRKVSGSERGSTDGEWNQISLADNGRSPKRAHRALGHGQFPSDGTVRPVPPLSFSPNSMETLGKAAERPKTAPWDAPPDWPSADSSSSRMNLSAVGGYGTLEVTPDNLGPLLEYVREVERKCGECLGLMDRVLKSAG